MATPNSRSSGLRTGFPSLEEDSVVGESLPVLQPNPTARSQVRPAQPPVEVDGGGYYPSPVDNIAPASNQPTEPFFCIDCKETLQTRSDLREHQARHNRPFLCNVPGCSHLSGFATASDLQFHKTIVHHNGDVYFECYFSHCKEKEKIWRRYDKFKAHLKRVHGIHEAADPKFDLWKFHLKVRETGLHGSRVPSINHFFVRPTEGEPLPIFFSEMDIGNGAAAPHGMERKFETHTDSGYGSHGAKTIACKSGHSHAENEVEPVHEDNNDTQTIYSDTTSLQDPRIDDYVAAFADELTNSLPPDASREELEGISDTLPDILEAFAGRIGYQAPGKLERQLKYLAHRYRIRIIDLVRRRLSQEDRNRDEGGSEDADVPDSPRNTDPEAGFYHKVPRWLAGCSVAEPGNIEDSNRLEDQDYADGTHQHPEDEEPMDVDELPDLPKYRHALCQSPAYRWLLSSFQVQRGLVVPGGQRCMRTQIRQAIIEKLRPQKMFSRRDPGEAKMLFKIDWDPRRFYMEQGYNVPLEDVLERAVTLTGHGNDVQVAICVDYMAQTWPETGAALLKFLQTTVEMFRRRDSSWSDTLPGGTVVCASLEKAKDVRNSSLTLGMEVTGNVFAIAELGEQLAWLGAALRSAPAGYEMVSCTPKVWTDINHDSSTLVHPHVNRMMPIKGGLCEVIFDLNIQDVGPSVQGSCWRELFRNPVIVSGFPIPRRQSSLAATGAQIPLDIASALINSNRFDKWAGTTYLKGFSALLAATKVVGETVFWHLVYNSNGSYISYEDPRVPRWPESADPLVLETLSNHRHVVGWCDRIISHAGASNAKYSDIGWSGLPGPNQSCALEKVTISGGQFINAGISCVLGLKDKPVHINHGDDYYGILQNISDRHFVFYDPDDRQAWLLDGASTVLHLLRASIRHHQDDKRLGQLLCSPGSIELDEASEVPTLGSRAEAAWEVLSNQDNLNIPLRLKNTSAWNETTIRQGEKRDYVTKEKTTYLTVGNRIEQICHILCQITAHHDDVHTQSGVGFRLRSTPRPQLEGFDFTDIATGTGTMWPRVATLKAKGQGWVDFARAIHAPTLFASGFDELFTPFPAPAATKTAISSCSSCLWNSPLPKGKDYLAATTSDLQAILRRRGNMRHKPWRLVDNIHWYSPDLTCEPCSGTCSPSGKKGQDRVQVLLPATFPRLFGRESPRKLPAHGAVIFGHSAKFPLIWGLKRGNPPEIGEPEENLDVEGMVERFEDSGIGTSLGSRSQNESEREEGQLGMGGDGALEGNAGSSSGSSSSTSASRIYRMLNKQFIGCNVGIGEAKMKRRGGEEDMRGGSVKKVRESDGHG